MLRVFDLARNFSEFILNAQKKKSWRNFIYDPRSYYIQVQEPWEQTSQTFLIIVNCSII